MNIEELKEFLHQIGVPKSSYNIDSDETLISPGTIIIERVANRLSDTGQNVMKYTNNVILKMRLKLFHTFYLCLRVAPINTVAGIANISSFDLVKHTSVPVIVMFIASSIAI